MLNRFRTTAAAAATSLCLVLVSTAPATAHTQSEAITNGCGAGFAAASDGTRAVTYGSSTWGHVHLA